MLHDRAQPRDGGSEQRVVQALGELWAAGAQAEGEPAVRYLVQAGGEHGNGRGAAAPDVEYPGAESDPAGAHRDLGEQHGCVVAPPLGQVEGLVAELFGP